MPRGSASAHSGSIAFLGGVGLCLAASFAAWRLSTLSWSVHLRLSSLTLAILAGMAVGNSLGPNILTHWRPGIQFSQQRLLRLGIILYGVRLTMQDLLQLGLPALILDLTVIGCVLCFGYWFGTRVLKLDPQTALLISAGSGICGAAAVLATDRVIEGQENRVAVAIATVVVFGTIAMFAYPLMYPLLGLTERQFGIYIGATVHEVAQVVAAGDAVGRVAGDTAVVTKMLRVLLLAPVLLLVARLHRTDGLAQSRPSTFPWFVVWFLVVVCAVSVLTPPPRTRALIIDLDAVLLGSAMFALGTGTRPDQLLKAGIRPMQLGATLFAGLVIGGYWITYWLRP